MPSPAISQPNTSVSPDEVRARAVMRDIYARHGIEDGTSPSDAARIIGERADAAMSGGAGWANPEERAAAREKYALATNGDQAEVKARWERSANLMDPESHEHHQKYGRDADFASTMAEAAGGRGGFNSKARTDALRRWDQSNNNPLYRDGMMSSGMKSQDSLSAHANNAINNPDTTSGSFLQAMDVPFHTLQMAGSGETGLLDSLRTALGNYYHSNRYRMNSPAPIGDLPSSAGVGERAERIASLQDEAARAAIPDSAERWQRTVGFTPAPYVRDMGDAVLSSIDPTMLIPGFGAAKTLGRAAKIAGGGWLARAAKQVASNAGKDQVAEQVTGAGLLGALGGNNPDRTWMEYLNPLTTPSELKSDQQVAGANAARRERYERSASATPQERVSAADDAAYSRLMRAGKVSGMNR